MVLRAGVPYMSAQLVFVAAGVIVALFAQFLPAARAADGVAAGDLVGLQASYAIASAGPTVSAAVTASDEGGASVDTVWKERTALATSTVVAQIPDAVTISTTVTGEHGASEVFVHDVALDGVLVPVTSEAERLTVSPSAGPADAVTVERRWHADGGWLTRFDVAVESSVADGAHLAVTLRDSSLAGVDVPDGHALFLLAPILPPSDLVAPAPATTGSSVPTATLGHSSAGEVGLAQAATAWAGSRLLTIDNPLANIDVWQSDFTHEGSWDTHLVEYNIEILAEALFFNWFAIGAEAWYGDVTLTSAEGYGRSDFLGVFVRGPLWLGEGWHRIDLRESSHDTWMRGQVWQIGCLIWNPWKDEWFLDNETYANGQRLFDEWYIVETTSEWLRIIADFC